MSTAKIAIVILNWNGSKLLQQFLPSVIQFSHFDYVEIVVADNGSTDESLSILRNQFPDVKILDLKQNFGFAQGYNLAIFDTTKNLGEELGTTRGVQFYGQRDLSELLGYFYVKY